jgi:predicted ArsR family transcriptional regulator
MARPVGELHRLIVEHIRSAGSVTAHELAIGLRLNIRAACQYLHYLNASGRIELVERVALPHMRRPAFRYRVTHSADHADAWSVLSAWPSPGHSKTELEDVGAIEAIEAAALTAREAR